MSDAPAAPAPAAPAATPAASEQKAAPPEARSLKVRDLEFKTEDEAYAEIQRGRQSGKLLTEADKRFRAAAEKEKNWEQTKATKDIGKIIEALGLPREEAVALFEKWYMDGVIKPSQMDPRERENADLKAKLKAVEDEKAAAAEKQKREALDKETEAEKVKLRQEIEGVLNGKKLPATRHALRRVADYLMAYGEVGQKVPMQIAVDRVLSDYRQEFGDIIDEAEPTQLEQFLGKERFLKLAKKVSQWALAASKGAATPPPPPASPHAIEDASNKQRRKISLNDWEQQRLFRGGK